MALIAGVPTRSETNSASTALAGSPNITASSGDRSASGRPVVSQCAATFATEIVSSDRGDNAITSSEPSSKSA